MREADLVGHVLGPSPDDSLTRVVQERHRRADAHPGFKPVRAQNLDREPAFLKAGGLPAELVHVEQAGSDDRGLRHRERRRDEGAVQIEIRRLDHGMDTLGARSESDQLIQLFVGHHVPYVARALAAVDEIRLAMVFDERLDGIHPDPGGVHPYDFHLLVQVLVSGPIHFGLGSRKRQFGRVIHRVGIFRRARDRRNVIGIRRDDLIGDLEIEFQTCVEISFWFQYCCHFGFPLSLSLRLLLLVLLLASVACSIRISRIREP